MGGLSGGLGTNHASASGRYEERHGRTYAVLSLAVAQRIESAFRTLRIARHAQRPPVQNHPVREDNPLVLGNNFDEVLFDFDRVGLPGEIEPREMRCTCVSTTTPVATL